MHIIRYSLWIQSYLFSFPTPYYFVLLVEFLSIDNVCVELNGSYKGLYYAEKVVTVSQCSSKLYITIFVSNIVAKCSKIYIFEW